MGIRKKKDLPATSDDKDDPGTSDKIGLDKVLASLSSDLVSARARAANAGETYGLVAAEVEVELTLTAVRDREQGAEAGVKLCVFTAGAKAGRKSADATMQRVRLTLRPPDADGDEPEDSGGSHQGPDDDPPDTEIVSVAGASRVRRTGQSRTQTPPRSGNASQTVVYAPPGAFLKVARAEGWVVVAEEGPSSRAMPIPSRLSDDVKLRGRHQRLARIRKSKVEQPGKGRQR